MTFKELLDSVTFEDVEEQLRIMYPEEKVSMGWYKASILTRIRWKVTCGNIR